eukprot:14479974-Ditylum_brightwellii.AAC.1
MACAINHEIRQAETGLKLTFGCNSGSGLKEMVKSKRSAEVKGKQGKKKTYMSKDWEAET